MTEAHFEEMAIHPVQQLRIQQKLQEQLAKEKEWSVEEVCQWMIANSLKEHVDVIRANNLDGGDLKTLTDSHFRDLGISSIQQHRIQRRLKLYSTKK